MPIPINKRRARYYENTMSRKAKRRLVCFTCGAKRCKLWRKYQTLADVTIILCGACTVKSEEKKGSFNEQGLFVQQGTNRPCSAIGWMIPAIPTKDGRTFWGYSSVPQSGCDWWYALPLVPIKKRK